MNKKEFLEELKSRLIGISQEDKKEILQDYEEHFKIGKKKKRTESEISKSLGEPKEIAKEIRRELSKKREGEELKTEAIETWVAIKKFSKHIFNETSQKIDEISSNFDPKKLSHWIWVALAIVLFITFISIFGGVFFFLVILAVVIFFGMKFTKRDQSVKTVTAQKKHNKKVEDNGGKTNVLNTTLMLLFNILIFLWIWIALFCAVISLFISGIAMIIAGILVSIFSVFSLIKYSYLSLGDIFYSSLFAGLGVMLLGILFTILFDKLLQLFFRLTKWYLRLNQRLIRK